ncbi:MAG: HD-GYP domain-containing protein [Treponema sp.]|nr:HD-GYP domain-containing protein [Treponema sp.]
MNEYNVKDIKVDTRYTENVYLDKSFQLIDKVVPFSSSLIKLLNKWRFDKVYSNGVIGLAAITPSKADEDAARNKDTKKPYEKLKETLDNFDLTNISDTQNPYEHDEEKMTTAKAVYNAYADYILDIYTHYATHKEFDSEDVFAAAKDLCSYVQNNKRFILRINPTIKKISKDFLIAHSVRSSIIAIILGLYLNMPLSKLEELAVACMLHEIGMIRLPPQFYMTDKNLTAYERAKIKSHPLLSFKILNDNGFSDDILNAVLNHHENERGTGYPRKLTGDKISIYAKIIFVACSYESITSSREYREAKSTYEAIVEMLRNESKYYDPTVIKALLCSVSLFPVGSYVYLINGKIAQVIDTITTSPRTPIVQLIGSYKDGKPVYIKTNETDLKIVRVLNNNELKDIAKVFVPNKDIDKESSGQKL